MSKKWDDRYLQLAREVSTWSKDPSTQCGALLIGDSGQVLSQGYNGFPRGMDDDPKLYNKRDIKYTRIVHAEMNAIYNASRSGISLKGIQEMVVTLFLVSNLPSDLFIPTCAVCGGCLLPHSIICLH